MRKVTKYLFLFLICFLFLSPFPVGGEEDENRTILDTLEEKESEPGEDASDSEEESIPFNDETDAEQEPTFMEERSLFSLFLRLFFALFVVVGFMYVLLKWMNKRTRQFQSHQTLQNLGGVPLGQNKSVQLIKVGERLLVIGVGDSIHLLKEIDSEEEIEALMEQHPSNDNDWKEKGTAIWNRFVRKDENEEKKQPPFSDLMEKELQEMSQTRKKARQQLKEFDS